MAFILDKVTVNGKRCIPIHTTVLFREDLTILSSKFGKRLSDQQLLQQNDEA
eukprot:m.133008 g.133008  ORF g.133008 m.133008 type:complete len:52 (-) comp23793_c0_seq1:1125-1280(-)